MNHDEIDRILASEDEIEPSPGFLASVMEAVEREAAAPPTLTFPWIRLLPGFLAMVVAMTAAMWHGIGVLSDPAVVAVLDDQIRQFADLATRFGLQWIVLGLVITAISIAFSSSLVVVATRTAR
jgi:hypothetical protein